MNISISEQKSQVLTTNGHLYGRIKGYVLIVKWHSSKVNDHLYDAAAAAAADDDDDDIIQVYITCIIQGKCNI